MTTTDRDGPRSNPYHPDPDKCCTACVFGTGEHAIWCTWCDNCDRPASKEGCGLCWHILSTTPGRGDNSR